MSQVLAAGNVTGPCGENCAHTWSNPSCIGSLIQFLELYYILYLYDHTASKIVFNPGVNKGHYFSSKSLSKKGF